MDEQGRKRRQWIVVAIGFAALAALIGVFVLRRMGAWGDYYDAERIAKLQKASLAIAAPSATDWPQWRGPARNGIAGPIKLRRDLPQSDAIERLLVWKAKVGRGFSSVSVAAGFAVTMFYDDGNETIVCWDAQSGAEKWRHAYPVEYHEAGIRDYGYGPRSTPTIEAGRVYCVGATGIMHCLELATGDVVWMRDLLADFEAPNLRWGVSFSPLIVGERIFVMPGGPADNAIAALDKQTGKTLWHNLPDPGAYSSPVSATIAGRDQVVFFTGQRVLGADPETGQLLWDFPWSTSFGVNAATPIVAGNYVFISSGYGKGCATLEIEATEGGEYRARRVYRNRNMKNHFSTCVLVQEHLYGFSDSVFTCMEFRSGKVRWTFPDRETFGKGSLIAADGKLIVWGEDGMLALVPVSAEKCEVEWSARVCETRRCWTPPALAAGLLYLRNQQYVWCLNFREKDAE